MEILEIIRKRRSIRRYKKQEILRETIEKLIEAARWAPSAGNIQPWEFVVVSSSKVKHALSVAAFDQEDLEEASVVIVVCADEKRAELWISR